MPAKNLIFIPTYNEKENVKSLYHQIRELGLDDTDILFMDDNSPDGTGDILDALARRDERVKVVHRAGKLGIGSAHQAGIRWAYDHSYAVLITMDADFTHQPVYIHELLGASAGHDIVITSRYLRKKSLPDWNLLRKILTFSGHIMTRVFLGMPYDATGAFRLYQLKNVPAAVFGLVRSEGYSFFFESLFVLNRNRFRIREIPISLPSRTYGHSKMRISDAIRSIRFLVEIFVLSVVHKKRYLLPDPPNQGPPHG